MNSLKLSLVLLFLSSALFLAGCAEQKIETPSPSPTPSLNAPPTPTPSPSSTPSPAASASPSPSPTPTAVASPWRACTQERQCLSDKPRYCENGVIVNNCGKCGCPTKFVCGRASRELGFSCIDPSLSIENWTEIAQGGNLTEILPTPTPTPAVLLLPYCDAPAANASNATVFLSQVAAAYKASFGRTTSFNEFAANSFVSLEQNGGYTTEIYLYAGKYRGWSSDEEARLSELNSSSCRKKFFVEKDGSLTNPNHYDFKMQCFNWTYSIDAKITEYAFKTPQGQTAESFATKLLDYCK